MDKKTYKLITNRKKLFFSYSGEGTKAESEPWWLSPLVERSHSTICWKCRGVVGVQPISTLQNKWNPPTCRQWCSDVRSLAIRTELCVGRGGAMCAWAGGGRCVDRPQSVSVSFREAKRTHRHIRRLFCLSVGGGATKAKETQRTTRTTKYIWECVVSRSRAADQQVATWWIYFFIPQHNGHCNEL